MTPSELSQPKSSRKYLVALLLFIVYAVALFVHNLSVQQRLEQSLLDGASAIPKLIVLSRADKHPPEEIANIVVLVRDTLAKRGLAVLDCAGNLLARLDLKSNSSLRSLDCRGNLLVTLDLPPPCSGQLQADTRDNPFLTTVYRRGSQGVDYNGPTEVVVR